MVLLRLLRFILFCGQDDEEQRFYDYRTHRNYTPISPSAPTSTSKSAQISNTAVDPLQYRLYRDDDDRTLLPPARSNMDSRGNLNSPAVANHAGGKPIASTPFSSSVIRVPSNPSPASKPSPAPISSTNINTSLTKLSIGPAKHQIAKDSSPCSPAKPSAALVPSKYQPPSISSSVIRVPSNPSPISKPSPAPISSTNINTPAIKFSIDPAKHQIAKDSATSSPAKPSAALVPSKFQAPSISSSAAPDPSSKKPSLSVLSSTNKISVDSAISTPERSHLGNLLSKFPSSSFSSSSTTKSSSPTLQSKGSSPVPISTVNNSFSGDGGRVWRKKKKQSSTASIRESRQNIYSASLSSIKVPSPDSSSSGSSSPSRTPDLRRNNRRVLSKYEIPRYLEEMIKKDIVPPILKSPLSPLTYCDYFATLLYAEDFYIEKWSDYLLEDVTLELRPRDGHSQALRPRDGHSQALRPRDGHSQALRPRDGHSQAIAMKRKNSMPDSKDYIAFKLEDIPEERPFLLSRDFVFLRPPNSSAEPFKGILFRVVRNVVLVEFGDDFHSQHSPSKRYDVSFSFNRVCLKRAHQAISISADPSFHSILFPDRSLSPHLHDRIPSFQDPARRIANHRGPIPFLVQGQLVTERSPTGRVLQLAMLNIYRANPQCRILVCSPTNGTSDLLLRSLRERIPDASFFRANAAFRDYSLVPKDIVPASRYEEEQERFSCPPLSELLNFNIVTSTFISSFRLSTAGIDSNHFSHIFLVDACLAIEPEAIVPLANLACGDTAVVVAGCSGKSPGWVRSEIARRNGLKESYFSRLLEREPYRSGDAMFTLQVLD